MKKITGILLTCFLLLSFSSSYSINLALMKENIEKANSENKDDSSDAQQF